MKKLILITAMIFTTCMPVLADDINVDLSPTSAPKSYFTTGGELTNDYTGFLDGYVAGIMDILDALSAESDSIQKSAKDPTNGSFPKWGEMGAAEKLLNAEAISLMKLHLVTSQLPSRVTLTTLSQAFKDYLSNNSSESIRSAAYLYWKFLARPLESE